MFAKREILSLKKKYSLKTFKQGLNRSNLKKSLPVYLQLDIEIRFIKKKNDFYVFYAH